MSRLGGHPPSCTLGARVGGDLPAYARRQLSGRHGWARPSSRIDEMLTEYWLIALAFGTVAASLDSISRRHRWPPHPTFLPSEVRRYPKRAIGWRAFFASVDGATRNNALSVASPTAIRRWFHRPMSRRFSRRQNSAGLVRGKPLSRSGRSPRRCLTIYIARKGLSSIGGAKYRQDEHTASPFGEPVEVRAGLRPLQECIRRMARDGIEPPTRRFSVYCSTN